MAGRGAQKNGRSGHAQHGVDVWGRRASDGVWCAVQCKGKDANYGKGVTEKELREEAAKARLFEPKLSHWILATTAQKDATIEAVARRISEEHAVEGLFEVRVLG